MARRKRITGGRVLLYVLLLITCVINIFPFYWMLRSSFMTKNEIFAQPMHWPRRIPRF